MVIKKLNASKHLHIGSILHLRGCTISFPDFTQQVLVENMEEVRIAYEEEKGEDMDIDKPDKFSHEKWIQWEESVNNYL